ncbi:MAG: protein kinase [Planctomycetes bacterium]|nr:protein kinase [Planctomycetota bacterium]
MRSNFIAVGENKTEMPDNIDKDELLRKFQEENIRLKQRNQELEGESTLPAAASIEGLYTLIVRIGADDVIQYVNSPFCRHFGVKKEDLAGEKSGVLKRLVDQQIFSAIARPVNSGSSSVRVKDEKGRSFEVQKTLKEGILDLVLTDVSDKAMFEHYVQRYVSTNLTKLSEEDLRTFKIPERRFMTVSFTDLRGFTAMCESMGPEEVRHTINAYLEEIIHAIDENHATVDKIVGDEVVALYGAPRYYQDHALRAIKTACDQMFNLKALQRVYGKLGKVMPDCGIGINSGDMVVGNLGSSTRQDYTVMGSAVNIAARLCGAARGAEIIITETTMKAALDNLPEGWQVKKARTKKRASAEGIGGKTEGVLELPENLLGRVYLIGPGVRDDVSKAEFSFHYQHAVKVKGVAHPLPIISVQDRRKKGVGSLELDDQTLSTTGSERVFGKYHLISRIGKGGMGEVWRARDSFGNILAIKMLLAGEGASENQLKRFKREAEVMSRLNHRGVCRIHEVGEFDHITYIAMECLEGAPLSAILKSGDSESSSSASFSREASDFSKLISEALSVGDSNETVIETVMEEIGEEKRYRLLPVWQTIALMIKVCDAVQYAHRHGVLHRDLKPGNIMVGPEGEPVVMDFGLAKLDTDDKEAMSLSGQIIGTMGYMAPEQARGSKEVNEATDVYSLGAILYQMITGKRHYVPTGNILTDANSLQNHLPQRPKEINKQIDYDLETITLKALRPEIAERYQNIAQLKDDLERYQSGEVIEAREVNALEVFWKLVKRNKLLSGVIVAAALVLLAMTAGFMWQLDAKRRVAESALARVIEEQQARELAETGMKHAEQGRDTEVKNKELIAKASGLLAEAEVLASKGEYEAACEKADAAKLLAPQWFKPPFLAGKYRQEMGLHEAALADLEKALALAPDEAGIRSAYNISASLLEKYDEVVAGFKEEEKAHYSLEDRERIGDAFFGQGRYNKAEVLYRELFDKDKTNDRISAKIRLSVLNLDNPMMRYPLQFWPEFVPGRTSWNAQRGSKNLKNISALKGLPLTTLVLGDCTQISDLSPIQGMPLTGLNLTSCTQVSDLSPIQGMPLTSLNLVCCKQISDLSPIQGMQLTFLNLANTQVSDLSPIQGMPLTFLSLGSTQVRDLSPIKGMPLTVLDFPNTQVSDLSLLKGMPLTNLNLANCIKVRDLSSIKGMPLTNLNLTGTQISDLSLIKDMLLTVLNLTSTQVSDLSLIKSLPLTNLNLTSCTQVSDLSPIKDMPLTVLILGGMQVSDLSPIKDLPLKELRLPPTDKLADGWIEIVKGLKDLAKINGLTTTEFWKNFESGNHNPAPKP